VALAIQELVREDHSWPYLGQTKVLVSSAH
jgi:hypothetical protein